MDPLFEEKTALLRGEWENYIHNEIASETTKKIILDSWKRCAEYGVPAENNYPLRVLNFDELEKRKAKNRQLIQISAPIRESIRRFIHGSHFVIALTDAEGVIIELTGDEQMKRSIIGGGFIEGADWSERSVGSNAIGTALAINQPVQFAGYEHYCTFTQKTACAAAPVHEPDGRLIGTIDLTGRLRDVNHHTLGMAVAMASDIENCLRISRAERKMRLENAYKDIMLQAMSQGVVALNERNVITHMNKAAADILHLAREHTGDNIQSFLARQESSVRQLFESEGTWTDRDLTLKLGRNQIRITATLRNIVDDNGTRLGCIIIFDEIKRTQRMVARYVGATARLTFDDIIGESAAFRRSIAMAQSAARSDASILLLGESGTGKDILAQAIHNASSRRDNPYVAINCGAIPKELVASELFGYAEGAFTGAKRGGSAGKFEMADGGTIFLDEIGEMPLDLQVHLLRVLENRTITRVGGAESIPINVRVIAATNADLKESVDAGLFRSDLYYRLNVISLNLPPLRERIGDIPKLIRHFYSQYFDGQVVIPEDYEEILCRYSWPGNIRELRNIIERTVSLSPDKRLRTDYLPADLVKTKKPAQNTPVPETGGNVRSVTTVRDAEKEALITSIIRNQGNITQAAKDLGISRVTVYRKLKAYGIDPEDLK